MLVHRGRVPKRGSSIVEKQESVKYVSGNSESHIFLIAKQEGAEYLSGLHFESGFWFGAEKRMTKIWYES